MAKQRKQKQKDAKSSQTPPADSSRSRDSCCATVRDQKLCVAVDVDNQRIYGYTELTVVSPKNGVIGLHARGLHIAQVWVDGSLAPFELLPPQSRKQQTPNGNHSFSSTADAADACYPRYLAALDEELIPELLIHPGGASTPVCCSQDLSSFQVEESSRVNGGDQPATSMERKVEVGNSSAVAPVQEHCNVVRVEYWVEKPLAGAHFKDNIFHTNSQLRRTRCWFPCVDSSTERCSYSLEITVASENIAVSNGKLLYQVYSKEGPHLKTYAYSMSIPITANYISLVVAPLVVLPDRTNTMISHFCMPGDSSKLQCTVNFFNLLFSTYEEYLGAPFPFGCYKQVFIDSESTISSTSVGASMVTLSSHLLVDERIIDQAFNTQMKLAHALAQQWFGVFITPDSAADAWLLEGLSGYLCDQFVKRFMGNNEARYRRFRANEAVCMVDGEGAPVLSGLSMPGTDLYGTERLGPLGQIRALKATAVVQMLEKQMGPEPFKKILQRIILRAQDPVRHLRTLSTKEFRHFANKLGNLERPFLKEFFPRWVESSGCPRLRVGFVYSKRRNMVELAVHREATTSLGPSLPDGSKPVIADRGWPGMMSIRIHELDGMYDHPSLPMAGDMYQLLDIQCHSKLAGRRVSKAKKGSKPDSADDNVDAGATDVRLSLESPLLWLRADPQMEYIAEIQLNQPEQMWINQLEKDRDVVGQLQAIAAMVALPRPSFAIATALNNSLIDPKVFCKVRVEAAAALASTATEANSWVGLSHLIKFYKSCRCDPEIGLPKSNDFHDLAEYFVLEAIPGAIAAVRGSDGKSPVEATDFILHILKHNDNSGNQYSDVFWLASVIESIGGFEFGLQNMVTLSKFLKQIDRFLQYDRLMPSYNGVLTISCIHTLTRLAVKFSKILPLERLKLLLLPYGNHQNTIQRVRVTALQSILEVEAHCQGLDGAVKLALILVENEPSLAVQSKIMEHIIELCGLHGQSVPSLGTQTLNWLLEKFDNTGSFSNVLLRHHLFSLLQILAGRSASLYRKEDALVLQVPPQQQQDPLNNAQKAPQTNIQKVPQTNTQKLPQNNSQKAPENNTQVKEVKTKATTPLKGKVQQPHAEPIRIRVVPVRPNVAKEEGLLASAISSGKGSTKGALRVGKVKLRLRPASLDGSGASPMEISVESLDKVIVTAASQSPASVKVSENAELMVEENFQSCPKKRKMNVTKVVMEEMVVIPFEEVQVETDGVSELMKEDGAEDTSLFFTDIGEGFGIGSSKESPNEVLHDASDKDGTESQILSRRPSQSPSLHENGAMTPFTGVSQLSVDTQEIHFMDYHRVAMEGPSEVSMNPAEIFSSTTPLSQEKDIKQKREKKDKKDKKDKKRKKEKKKHDGEKDEDPENRGKVRSKENDIEYQERKRKRKEEKNQRKLEKEGRKVQKLDIGKSQLLKAKEIISITDGSKVEDDPGQKIRLKFKKIITVPTPGRP